MGHGYMPATSMKNNRGTNLDEQDREEQIREEAWAEAWEISLDKAQDMVRDIHLERQIQNIVEVVAMTIMRENNDVE